MSSVSVIVPCYQYAHYLRRCVESVLTQEGIEIRVLILDDCSPDTTPEVGAKLAAEDSRVEYRRHTVNQRHIATYNEGLAWADGDYTLLLSADDLLTSGALVRAARVLDAHPEVGLVYGRQILFEGEVPRERAVRQDAGYRVAEGSAFVARMCAGCDNPVNTPTAVVRTKLLADVGGYSADLPHTADMELWLRFAARGAVAVLEAEQAYKRMHGQNMQLDYTEGELRDLQARQAAFANFFRKCGDRLPDGAGLHARAVQALADTSFWAASRAFDRRKLANSRALLDYALSLNPELASRPEYSRFRLKQRLGPRVWSVVRPVVEAFRNRGRKDGAGAKTQDTPLHQANS